MCVARDTACVTRIESRPKNKWRPLPLATVELQMRASSQLRLASDKTMALAESLYANRRTPLSEPSRDPP